MNGPDSEMVRKVTAHYTSQGRPNQIAIERSCFVWFLPRKLIFAFDLTRYISHMNEFGQGQSLDVGEGTEGTETTGTKRPFLQIFFRCANTYMRVYRNASGDAYNARCAKCGKAVNFRVGEGGTDTRVFEVNCRG